METHPWSESKKQVKGKAKVVDKNTGAKLKVTFFWPFYGDYWIINLGKDYEYAVVGTPNRKYLWILSRTPHMNEKLFSQLIELQRHKVSMLTVSSRPVINSIVAGEGTCVEPNKARPLMTNIR